MRAKHIRSHNPPFNAGDLAPRPIPGRTSAPLETAGDRSQSCTSQWRAPGWVRRCELWAPWRSASVPGGYASDRSRVEVSMRGTKRSFIVVDVESFVVQAAV